MEKHAAYFAGRGLVAMTIDYRGWGRSGGFLYLAEPVRWDDRLRFSQHTAKVRIRRKRNVPDAQILDIRNAISLALEQQGVEVEVHHHEVGAAGQNEIGTRFAPLIQRAD